VLLVISFTVVIISLFYLVFYVEVSFKEAIQFSVVLLVSAATFSQPRFVWWAGLRMQVLS
jgi:hypothetical protein